MSLDFRFDPTNELESKGEKVKGHKIFRSLIPSVTRVPTDWRCKNSRLRKIFIGISLDDYSTGGYSTPE